MFFHLFYTPKEAYIICFDCSDWVTPFLFLVTFSIPGDTMTVQDPVAMNLGSALWAVVSYTVADLPDMLPRH